MALVHMAAAEFLVGYLKYDHEDMTDLEITDTRTSAKGDGILYIVLDSPEKTKNVRRRIADCQNPIIKTREYIPPQFYRRYTALGKVAHEMRLEDPSLKTQIRFQKNDICLFTKVKGSDDPFVQFDMNIIEEKEKLPAIEFDIPWKKRVEHPPWRRTSPEIRQVTLKSLAQRTEVVPGSRDSDRLDSKSRRQRDSSGSGDRQITKKKNKLSADSSDGDHTPSPDGSPASRKNSDISDMNTSN